jgi:membrane protease YdiL (CAAX protease family)
MTMVLPRGGQERAVPVGALIPFVAITFLVAWSALGVYVVAPTWAAARFGPMSGTHPAFYLATWAPAIAGVSVVLWYAGIAGLRGYLMRLTYWRCSPAWALFVLIGIPLVFVAGSLAKGGPSLAPLPEGGPAPMLAVMFAMLLLGPVEELGWRGVAQPLLQRRMAPVWAGLVVGAVWGVWHLPAFHLAGTLQAEWSFTPFLIGNIALAVLMAGLFNRSRGSLLWAMLFHWQLINPFWPDAQPWDTWILVLAAVAAVWWDRAAMFGRTGVETDVTGGGHAV